MKKILVNGLTVLALVLSLANCGKSGGGNNPTTYPAYNPAYTTPYPYNQQYQQMYGGNYNYCNQYAQGCIQCQYPQCNTGGCNWNQVYYAQPGYYAPQYGQYGQGGAFSMAVAW